MKQLLDQVKLTRKSWIQQIPWILWAAEYLWLVLYYYLYGGSILNSDMSAEMVLASLLNREGALFLSKNWFYSTELRILNPPMVYRIGLFLFSDWHLARTFSIAILLLFYFLCFLYFAKCAHIPNNGIWAALLLFCPMSGLYVWIVLYGNFYITYLSLSFLCLGLFFRATDLPNKQSATYKIHLFLLLGFAFIAGLHGVRYLLILFIPLTLCYSVKYIHQCQANRFRFTKSHTFNAMFISWVMLGNATVGYLLNMLWLSRVYTFCNFGGIMLQPFRLDELIRHFGEIVTLLGYQCGIALFSVQGLRAILSLLYFTYIIYKVFIKHESTTIKSNMRNRIQSFALFSLLLNLLVSSITGQTDLRYLIPSISFCVAATTFTVAELPDISKKIKNGLRLIMIVYLISCFAAPSLSMFYGEHTNEIREAVSWLKKNGYSQGYATFWNSDISIELSDGKLDLWTLYDNTDGNDRWESLELYPWLQEKQHLVSAPSGQVFVLLSDDEYTKNPPFIQTGDLVYQQNGYIVLVYPSADEMYKTVK